MVSIKKISVALVALIGALILTSTSYAQKIGVVDGNQVLSDYSAAQDADKKIRTLAQTYQDTVNMKLKNRQEKFEAASKSFESMTKEAQQKAQGEIDEMLADAQKYNQEKLAGTESVINKERVKLLEPILAKIKEVIATVSKKKGLDIVIDSKAGAIYVGDKVTDITKEVTSALK
jgi:Skp family chaperone for outer membrane proteins